MSSTLELQFGLARIREHHEKKASTSLAGLFVDPGQK